jgi:hypothetical protein
MKLRFSDHRFQILVFLGIIFFFIYSFLIFGNSASKFTWPDETANYFFIKNYIEHSNFSVAEPLNEIANDLIKPRSFNVHNHNLVPGSFLGMLLIYGLIGKIVGISLIKFLTPLLAVLAGLFFYKILLKIFEPKIAFISALLFYLNPAWWYYANLSMLPNIAFLTFILVGLYFLLKIDKEKKQKNWLLVILSAFFIGLALIIRTNEFLWILGILIFLAIFYFKKIKWQHIIIFLIINILVFLPIFYYNQQTFGSYLSFGYLRFENGPTLISQLPSEFKVSNNDTLNFIKFIVLPFGFQAKTILKNFYNYYFILFWWLLLGAVLGGFICIKNFHEKKQGVYFLLCFIISLYLLIYYGSWNFADPLTLALNKIGISYVRYFLPIYILSLPFVAIFLSTLTSFFQNQKIKVIIGLFFALIFLGFSINIVYLSGYDNLIKIKQSIKEYTEMNGQVVGLTEKEAVIISSRSDKILFPERKVIGAWQVKDVETWSNMIEAGIPVYYFATESVDFLMQLDDILYEYDLELNDETRIKDENYLYSIKPIIYDE